MAGGRTTPGVMRVADTVRRPRSDRSGFVARVVMWLNQNEYPYAPTYFGVDDEGRDIFEYIDGAITDHPGQRDESAYSNAATMLRELHALTDDMAGAGQCLLHGDPGAFNVVCREGRPVALIDWDAAHFGDPLEDVGYAAWSWCIQSAGNVPVADQARRLGEFRDGYDPQLAGAVMLDAVVEAQSRVERVETGVRDDHGRPGWRREHARAAIAWARSDRVLVEVNLPIFQAALR